jgi:hypothetical protein
MRPDSGLSGPIDVKGRIIIGYHTEVSQAYVDGRAVYGQNCNGPCTISPWTTVPL